MSNAQKEKVLVTGVRFRRACKIYNFISAGVGEKAGDKVVVEGDKGEDIVTVVYPEREIEVDTEAGRQMKKVIRKATEKDIEAKRTHREEEAAAAKTCAKLAEQGGLHMKLLMAEYSLDKSKLTFFYTAENRVDFRQLVKDLAKTYHTRIEMRQVGVRDAAKVMGGFGVCGREFCCCSFLKKFDNISIKTIKGQNASLNPSKISGVCGRLMCCLVFEKGLGAQGIIDDSGVAREIVIEAVGEEEGSD